MPLCPSCSKEVPEGSRFCLFCGARIEVDVDINKKTISGQTIAGKYYLDKKIGSGAMGSIYKGKHLDLNKAVVVKVLHAHLVSDDEQIKRFKREARAASQLNHPNVVSIYDFGHTHSGLAYIVMEYIEGEDLRRILYNEGNLDPIRTIKISLQVLSALAEAHAAGIIHRDIKPENIMISQTMTGEEVAKVLDFGIAKLQDMSIQGSIAVKTATGTIFGTPEYMSPEQITGKPLDPRSDLYSYGITMYEMLVGSLPFEGKGLLEIADKQLREPLPSIREKVPECPKELEDFIVKLTAKKREDRWQSAIEAHDRLEEILHQLESGHTEKSSLPSAENTSQKGIESGQSTAQSNEDDEDEEDERETMLIQDPKKIEEIKRRMEEAQIKKREAIFEVDDTKDTKTGSSNVWLWVGVGAFSLIIILAGVWWFFLR